MGFVVGEEVRVPKVKILRRHIFRSPNLSEYTVIYPLCIAFKHFSFFRFSRLQDYCIASLFDLFDEEDDQEDPLMW